MSDTEKFNMTVQSPMGPQDSELHLSQDGDQLEGKMVAAAGETSISDGKADGDQLSWTAQMDKPMPITLSFTGTRSGDSIEGEVKFGAFGSGPFTATKA